MAAHRVPSPADAFYAATKHGLRALAEGLRQEVSLAVVTTSTGLKTAWCQPKLRTLPIAAA